MVFGDEFYIVTFMREGTINPNCTYLVQCISQIYAPDNIDLKDTWLTPNIEEDPSYTPSDDPSVYLNNNNIMLTSLQPVLNVQEIPSSEGAPVSEVMEFTDSLKKSPYMGLSSLCPGCDIARQ